MDDQVIDLAEYVRKRDEATEPDRTTFAIWGGDGERARFALPLWRAAYLVSMSRAALVWEPVGEAPSELNPAVILDLAREPARLDVPGSFVEGMRAQVEPPMLQMGPEGGAVYLGQRAGRRWYIVMMDPSAELADPIPDYRENLFFVAGECAGLLFHRGLDAEEGEGDALDAASVSERASTEGRGVRDEE